MLESAALSESELAQYCRRGGPGEPKQHAYVERYNRTVRYDWLSHYFFDYIDQLNDVTTQWLWTYSHEGPNMALGGISPRQNLALAA